MLLSLPMSRYALLMAARADMHAALYFDALSPADADEASAICEARR